MKTIKLKEGNKITKYTLPESWNEVTVADFKKWSNEVKGYTGLDVIIKTISCFSGIKEDVLWGLDQSLLDTLTQPIGFIVEPIDQAVKESVELNNETYFIKRDFNELAVGEVRAIEDLLKGDLVENLNLLLTIFVRRKNEIQEWEPITPKLISEQSKFDQIIISDIHGLFDSFTVGVAS